METRNTSDREEYVEQEYFFRVYRERLEDGMPSQEILRSIREEILSTTRLPLAIDFMRTEILHNGRISGAMKRLSHYFAPFQTFVIEKCESDTSRFEQKTALLILEREAGYRASAGSPAGLFVFQLECLTRNRLGFDEGIEAIAADPWFSQPWSSWVRSLRQKLGVNDLAELVYHNSAHHPRFSDPADSAVAPNQSIERSAPDSAERPGPLFGRQEGRIARANVGRDPLYFFAALQRQLGYPQVPRPLRAADSERLPGFLEARLKRMEQRLKLLELEEKGGIDLSKFYRSGPNGNPVFTDEPG